jgi:hypothetical protein
MRRLLWCLTVILPVFLLVSCSDNSKAPQESLTAVKAGESKKPAKDSKPKQTDRFQPNQVHILEQNAQVVPVYIQGSALIPPRNPKVLGWWGKKVGSRHGATLLVGHTVHTGGGTLDDLEKVDVGTVIPVLDWSKNSFDEVDYKIVKNETISKAALAKRASQLFSQTGPPRLVVVTCENYNWATGHYASNVVVLAKPVF